MCGENAVKEDTAAENIVKARKIYIRQVARMNERVDRYVAELVQEGDQHAPQGGIAGNADHVVPLPDLLPFDLVEAAVRARSSAADIASSISLSPVDHVEQPADQSEALANDIVIEPPDGGTDLNLAEFARPDQNKESCGVRKKGPKFDRRLSEGSTKSLGVTLASGRVCHWLIEDTRRASPMSGMH